MSEKPAQEKIIDAEVEPLGKTGSGSGRSLRIVLYLLAAVVLSVAIAVGYHLAVSGRLDGLLSSAPSPASRPSASAPGAPAPSEPAPSAAASSIVPMSPRDTRLDQLESRFAGLTASIERLQQLPAPNAADPQKLADLEQQAVSLRAALETATAQRAAMQTQLAELQGRMTALSEARLASLREPLAHLAGWNELREHARRGDSFAREATALGTYAEAQGGNLKSAFAALQPFAEQRVPSAAALAARFGALAEQQRATPPSADTAAADKPWWQRAVDKLSGLVSIRRTGAPDAATLDGRLDLASAALSQGDLKAAVAELDGQALAAPLAEWRDQAQARLRLDAALDAYGAALRAHLSVQ